MSGSGHNTRGGGGGPATQQDPPPPINGGGQPGSPAPPSGSFQNMPPRRGNIIRGIVSEWVGNSGTNR
ncbi:hypothetical protein C2S53_012030 [Perilla frutescens var. hirtella]|uniref:Uncharacterized protein n=1 Tax=Perilla frutescens var. hirtella TaxID=608512 RepID=A0AAD4JLL1_PERFH|nr:hypothetical protein C2S53_012030 [Perilla frutescens var. hirtella]